MIALARSRPAAREKMDPWPLRGEALKEIGAAYLTLASFGLFVGWLLLNPLAGTPVADWDRNLALWFAEGRNGTLDLMTDIGSAFANTFNVIAALVVLVVGMAWFWKRWRESLTLGLALALEASVFLAVSLITGRDRPPVEQLDASPPTASFPSGHTGAAFAFYITLALIVFWNTERPILRAAALAFAVLVPPAVAVSRMYRGMHFLTDVVIGALLGIACVVAAVVIVRRGIARRALESSSP